MSDPVIIRRAQWGARYPLGTEITVPTPNLYLHHTAATFTTLDPEAEIRQMRSLEETARERFGSTVSYSLVVFPSGRVYEGAGIGRKGTHTKGHNSDGHAVACAGNYETQQPTEAMKRTLRAVQDMGVRRGWWDDTPYTPHREVSTTACPGRRLVAALPVINRPDPIPTQEEFHMDDEAEAAFAAVNRRLDALAHEMRQLRTAVDHHDGNEKARIQEVEDKLDQSHPGTGG